MECYSTIDYFTKRLFSSSKQTPTTYNFLLSGADPQDKDGSDPISQQLIFVLKYLIIKSRLIRFPYFIIHFIKRYTSKNSAQQEVILQQTVWKFPSRSLQVGYEPLICPERNICEIKVAPRMMFQIKMGKNSFTLHTVKPRTAAGKESLFTTTANVIGK